MIGAKKILVPVERSEYKNKIVEYAISLSKTRNAEITAIHVLDFGHGVGDGKDTEIKQEKIQEKQIHPEALLNEIDLTARKEEIDIEMHVLKKNDTIGKQ